MMCTLSVSGITDAAYSRYAVMGRERHTTYVTHANGFDQLPVDIMFASEAYTW